MTDTYDITIKGSAGETWLWVGATTEEAEAAFQALPKPTLTEGFGAGRTAQQSHAEFGSNLTDDV